MEQSSPNMNKTKKIKIKNKKKKKKKKKKTRKSGGFYFKAAREPCLLFERIAMIRSPRFETDRETSRLERRAQAAHLGWVRWGVLETEVDPLRMLGLRVGFSRKKCQPQGWPLCLLRNSLVRAGCSQKWGRVQNIHKPKGVWFHTSSCFSPLENLSIFPVMIGSLNNQQGKVKHVIEQVEAPFP